MKKILIKLVKEEGQILTPQEEQAIIESIIENECKLENIEGGKDGAYTVTITAIGQKITP